MGPVSTGSQNVDAKTGDQAQSLDVNTPVTTGPSGNGNGAQVSTVNETHVLTAVFPSTPPVAPTAVGNGAIAIPGHCGPLVMIKRIPIEYAVKPFMGKIRTITLQGQYTEVVVPYEEPVTDKDGNVEMETVLDPDDPKQRKTMQQPKTRPVAFFEIRNENGSYSKIGSIYDRAAIVVSSSMGSQAGLTGIGGAVGGAGSFGNAGTFTGTEQMITPGTCVYLTYSKDNPADRENEQLRQDNAKLKGLLDQQTKKDK